MRTSDPGDKDRPRLDAECLAMIGCSLRAYYSGFVKQPIPEHLADILARIESPPTPGGPVVPRQDARSRNAEMAPAS